MGFSEIFGVSQSRSAWSSAFRSMRIPICEGAADSFLVGAGYMATSMATMEISWVFMGYETDQEMWSEVDSHSLVPVRLAFCFPGKKNNHMVSGGV